MSPYPGDFPDIEEADRQAQVLQLLKAAGYSGQPEPAPQLQPSPGVRIGPARIGGGTLDALSAAALRGLQGGPQPTSGGGRFAQGFLQGYAGDRAAGAQARQMQLEAASEAARKKNEAGQRFRESAAMEVQKARDARRLKQTPSGGVSTMGGSTDIVEITDEIREWARQNGVAIAPGVTHLKASALRRSIPLRAQGTSVLSPEAEKMLAERFLQTGQIPAGFGRSPETVAGVVGKAAKSGKTGYDVGVAAAGYKADSQSRGALQKMSDNAEAFIRTADGNAEVLRGAMQKIKDSGVSWANRPVRALTAGLGDVDQARFRAAVRVLTPEFARIISSPNMTGVLTNEARNEMQAVMSEAYTIPQLEGALQILLQDSRIRRDAYRQQLKDIEGRMRGGGPAEVPVPADTPPKGNEVGRAILDSIIESTKPKRSPR